MLKIFYIKDRPPTDEEIISFFHMVFAPDQNKWNFYNIPKEITNKSNREFIKYFRETLKNNKNNWSFWAKEDGQIVGMVGINQFRDKNKTHCAELGFGVSKKFQRKNIGYQLVCMAIKKAKSLGFKRLEADCFANNTRAIGLLRKVGFKKKE